MLHKFCRWFYHYYKEPRKDGRDGHKITSLVAWTSEITKGTADSRESRGLKLKAIDPSFPLEKGKSSPNHIMKVRSLIPFLPNDSCRLYNAFGGKAETVLLPCEHFFLESLSFINIRREDK